MGVCIGCVVLVAWGGWVACLVSGVGCMGWLFCFALGGLCWCLLRGWFVVCVFVAITLGAV